MRGRRGWNVLQGGNFLFFLWIVLSSISSKSCTAFVTQSQLLHVAWQLKNQAKQSSLRFPAFTQPGFVTTRIQQKAGASSSSKFSTSASTEQTSQPRQSQNSRPSYSHTAAILTFPRTSRDYIQNEQTLDKAISSTDPSGTLSILLKCRDQQAHRTTLPTLCRHLAELYSKAWDAACEKNIVASLTPTNGQTGTSTGEAMENSKDVLDVVVYPQGLPNAAPEHWVYLRPSLQCIIAAENVVGWHSEVTSNSNTNSNNTVSNKYVNRSGDGYGGLQSHVDAINADRKERNLSPLDALSVDPHLPLAAQRHEGVVFLEDDVENDDNPQENNAWLEKDESRGILGGLRLVDSNLYNTVAVGGTFDGMHYGHRKLLTLAVSAVEPKAGKLLIGVTVDRMLQSKELKEYIPPLEQRIREVKKFVDALAPGLKNRRRVVAIDDAFGPPGKVPLEGEDDFDALVLSDETLENGMRLNQHRVEKLGLKPLALLCTRRTEPNFMSSTWLRRMKRQKEREIEEEEEQWQRHLEEEEEI